MADTDRTSPRSVTFLEQVEEAPHAFDFFQAIRRLDCAYPDKPQTGHSSRAADDPVRFGQEASMAFAPATLQALERSDARPPRLVQRFFGLLGPQGPLPLHLTEYIRDRLRNHDDFTLLRFLDVFHHRMISLFYRAWARVRPTVSFDQPASDRFADYVGSTFGLGMRSLTKRDALPDLPKRHFAGLMSCQTRHAQGLLAILSGFFGLPVQIEEFVGQWIELPANCRCLVGISSARLGMDTTVGSHVWDCQQKFRVIFGPLSLDDYYRMLPGGGQLSSGESISEEASLLPTSVASHARTGEAGPRFDSEGDGIADGRGATSQRAARPPDNSLRRSDAMERSQPPSASLERLIAAIRGYVGDELQWDLQLILRSEDTPPLAIGSVGHLGWTSWMMRDHMTHDPADLVLNAMQGPDNAETVEFRHVRKWNHRTLGQTRDGRYIVATIDPGEFDVAPMKLST